MKSKAQGTAQEIQRLQLAVVCETKSGKSARSHVSVRGTESHFTRCASVGVKRCTPGDADLRVLQSQHRGAARGLLHVRLPEGSGLGASPTLRQLEASREARVWICLGPIHSATERVSTKALQVMLNMRYANNPPAIHLKQLNPYFEVWAYRLADVWHSKLQRLRLEMRRIASTPSQCPTAPYLTEFRKTSGPRSEPRSPVSEIQDILGRIRRLCASFESTRCGVGLTGSPKKTTAFFGVPHILTRASSASVASECLSRGCFLHSFRPSCFAARHFPGVFGGRASHPWSLNLAHESSWGRQLLDASGDSRVFHGIGSRGWGGTSINLVCWGAPRRGVSGVLGGAPPSGRKLWCTLLGC